ncbi:signal peptidase I [Actinosynnema mirum]|uniref:Signal peptidase I n=1 Tax=Actinosynnema mirum (strain ATCC 29888 / DSM 43827 / JCM 3225 / NBRC 14064 / NCIMB 13271 / NRRL B-12336 / IMRU 3971 / 101) TaxID=446462 RepID=C6WK26_ACTMD|nr:signal peptidase I [Actinosynnema mirum]ACU38239.1 peptidase S26B, signal peptidase [Actinosynnema mirum DSM 43827]
MKPWWRLVARCALAFTGAVALTLALCAFAPVLWGWRPVVVTSGSMEPLVRPGDVVLLDPTPDREPLVGDVVVYSRSDAPSVTHRVVGRDDDGRYRTRGDANPTPDAASVAPEDVLGRVRGLVPGLGAPALFLHRHPSAAVPLAVLGGAGLLVLLLSRRRPRAAAAAVLLVPALAVTTGGVVGRTEAEFSATTAVPATVETVSRFYPQKVLAANPVSYWRLGEKSGNARADERGANPLTCVGATGGAPGARPPDSDTATTLPTASAHCAAGSGAALSFTGPFTVIVWTRSTAFPPTPHGRLVAKYGGGTGQINYLLSWNDATTAMRALLDTGSGRYTVVKPMPSDTAWHEVAMTWDGAGLRLYLDGQPAGSTATVGTPVTTPKPFTLGYTDADSVVGDVDEVSVFARALTDAEIADLHAAS